MSFFDQFRGRTIFEIITGRNKKKSLELQFSNPLNCKIGNQVSIDRPEITHIDFKIQEIYVYKTTVMNKDFYHTDYQIRGIDPTTNKSVYYRLRFIADDSLDREFKFKIQLLSLDTEMVYDKVFHENVLGDESGEIHIDKDQYGNDLENSKIYWRVNDVKIPYTAKVTKICDYDKNGNVEQSELEESDIDYWDYSRLTDQYGPEEVEFFTVEMDLSSGYFMMFCGVELLRSNISVY